MRRPSHDCRPSIHSFILLDRLKRGTFSAGKRSFCGLMGPSKPLVVGSRSYRRPIPVAAVATCSRNKRRAVPVTSLCGRSWSCRKAGRSRSPRRCNATAEAGDRCPPKRKPTATSLDAAPREKGRGESQMHARMPQMTARRGRPERAPPRADAIYSLAPLPSQPPSRVPGSVRRTAIFHATQNITK